jgi:surface protein
MSTHEFEIEWDLKSNEFEIELSHIQEIYPELEDLEITPKAEEQNFKSNKYGYNNVKVKAVESEELHIIPSTEEQIKEGIFNKVTVEAIEDLDNELTEQNGLITEQETAIDDILEALHDKAGIGGEHLEITPSTETQVKEGMFNKVTVEGDSELLPENIKKGVSLFGVEGSANTFNGKITDASYLFYGGARLGDMNELLPLCENVTNVNSMFYNCNKLETVDLSKFDTSNVTIFANLFYQCNKLKTVNLSNFDTRNATNLQTLFYHCNKLETVDLSNFDTRNVTTVSSMFYYCSSLIDLDLSNFDFSKVNILSYILVGCSKLVNIKSFKNLGKGYTQKANNSSGYKLDLSSCTQLTYESLMDVINNLYDLNLSYDVANGGTLYTQSLTLGSTNVAKLTEEEIAIANSKGWTVS